MALCIGALGAVESGQSSKSLYNGVVMRFRGQSRPRRSHIYGDGQVVSSSKEQFVIKFRSKPLVLTLVLAGNNRTGDAKCSYECRRGVAEMLSVQELKSFTVSTACRAIRPGVSSSSQGVPGRNVQVQYISGTEPSIRSCRSGKLTKWH